MKCTAWAFLAFVIAAAPIAQASHNPVGPEPKLLFRQIVKRGHLVNFLCPAVIDSIDTDGDRKPDFFIVTFEPGCAEKLWEKRGPPEKKKGDW